jgi:type II secretory pathway predicted ATPase ExeA
MYQAYWGFARSPFQTADARAMLAASPVHTEALARLDFLVESQCRFGLLLGPAGSGKSLVLADFADRTAARGWLVAAASAALPTDEQLLASLASGWQIASPPGGEPNWPAIADRLEELKLENLAAALALDDLDRATPRALAAVEWLAGLPAAPLTIIASARPETVERIGSRLVELATLRIDLTPWSEQETKNYLATSVTNAGRLAPAFDEPAARRLYQLSGGIPRKVNRLAQLALVAGAGQNLAQVDACTVEAVEEELSVG